jgi:hypothetical protein
MPEAVRSAVAVDPTRQAFSRGVARVAGRSVRITHRGPLHLASRLSPDGVLAPVRACARARHGVLLPALRLSHGRNPDAIAILPHGRR